MKTIMSICFLALILSACSAINPKASTSEGIITKAQFEQIKDGMTYKEVVAIIGGEGELVTESGKPGEELYTVAYIFNGKGSVGANANFMFQGGKLITKAQAGLK